MAPVPRLAVPVEAGADAAAVDISAAATELRIEDISCRLASRLFRRVEPCGGGARVGGGAQSRGGRAEGDGRGVDEQHRASSHSSKEKKNVNHSAIPPGGALLSTLPEEAALSSSLPPRRCAGTLDFEIEVLKIVPYVAPAMTAAEVAAQLRASSVRLTPHSEKQEL